jgi:hypothetical protein
MVKLPVCNKIIEFFGALDVWCSCAALGCCLKANFALLACPLQIGKEFPENVNSFDLAQSA